jgi:hypothetical protein
MQAQPEKMEKEIGLGILHRFGPKRLLWRILELKSFWIGRLSRVFANKTFVDRKLVARAGFYRATYFADFSVLFGR